MELENIHLRHCMLFQFWAKKNAVQAAKAICDVYGIDAISERTCQKWFDRFRGGNYDLNDDERSGRPEELQTDEFVELLDENPAQSTSQLAEQLGVDKSTVSRRLKALGKIQKVGKWVPHKLTEINIGQRLKSVFFFLLKFKKKDFLYKIVT